LEISLSPTDDENKRKPTPTPRGTNPPVTPPPIEEPEVGNRFNSEEGSEKSSSVE
jgi:hypothetical protein